MIRMKTIALFIFLFTATCLAQTQHTAAPSTTDAGMGAPDNLHFAYINTSVTAKNKLFLFLPGTGGYPVGYRLILKEAANLGYHSIGLTYPNAEAINVICAATTSLDCHSKARLEVLDGIDRHPDVSVDATNCIKNRTLKFLQYLHTQYPTENWNQYFSADSLYWHKIIVSGHSQGGGHAGIIGKVRQVDRVIMFAAMDWVISLDQNPAWVTWTGETSPQNYFGFIHQNDEALNFTDVQTTWDNFGMFDNGVLVREDTSSAPYNNSHTLYTIATPATDPDNFHGSVVVDPYVPLDGNNNPLFQSLWQYLIDYPVTITSVKNKIPNTIKISPNPFTERITIENTESTNFSISNTLGEKIKSGTVNGELHLGELPVGIYFLTIEKEGMYAVVKIIKEN